MGRGPLRLPSPRRTGSGTHTTMVELRECRVTIVQGDISTQSTEAIVNAANSTLLGGGGVDGAIHARAGPELLEACRELRRTRWPQGLPTGEAAITRGGRLRAKFVIHTVGPVWQGGGAGEAEALRKAYTNCLRVAEEQGVTSIAFPSISTGAYGYPMREACRVAILAVADYLASAPPTPRGGSAPSLQEVRFVLYRPRDLRAFVAVQDELGRAAASRA